MESPKYLNSGTAKNNIPDHVEIYDNILNFYTADETANIINCLRDHHRQQLEIQLKELLEKRDYITRCLTILNRTND